jgi:hypothetical protein
MKIGYRPYTNTAIVAMGALSLLCSIIVLTLFIIFISLSKPSFHDLNKFDLATLGLDFFLSLLYGVLTFIKDIEISKYGTKTWLTALILFTIVITHNVVALYKHHTRVLLTIALSIPIGTSAIIILVTSHFYFNEAVVPDVLEDYMNPTNIEDFSDFEEGEVKGLIKKVVSAPSRSIVNDHVTMNERIGWKKTHFIVAIENDLTIKKRWKQIVGGIKYWLNTLSSCEDVLISSFSFDILAHNPKLYKTPAEMLEEIEGMIPIENLSFSLNTAIINYEEVIKNKEGKNLKTDEWLHYGILIAAGESSYKEGELEEFMRFKKKNEVNFFFTAITQTSNMRDINKLTIALEGVHYTINRLANFGKAFTEAMQKHPLEN